MSELWSDEDTKFLVENFATMTVRDLALRLNKSEPAVRGKKGRMRLREKHNPFTQEEKNIIIKWYIEHPYRLDLDKLCDILQRPETSVCRVARKLGLTDICRTFEKKSNNPDPNKVSRRGTSEGARKGQAKFIWRAKNDHYKGMLGKHHTEETKERMSESHINTWVNYSDEEKQLKIENMGYARKQNYGKYPLSYRLYSKGNVGFRNDLQHYFRSNWEANVARYLNLIGVKWQYEPKRFFFKEIETAPNSYLPDFYLEDLDTWVEVKGWMDDKSKLKLEYFNEYYPDEFAKLIVIDQKSYTNIQKEFGDFIENWEYKKKNKNKESNENGEQ
jgi:hypothetical protein